MGVGWVGISRRDMESEWLAGRRFCPGYARVAALEVDCYCAREEGVIGDVGENTRVRCRLVNGANATSGIKNFLGQAEILLAEEIEVMGAESLYRRVWWGNIIDLDGPRAGRCMERSLRRDTIVNSILCWSDLAATRTWPIGPVLDKV